MKTIIENLAEMSDSQATAPTIDDFQTVLDTLALLGDHFQARGYEKGAQKLKETFDHFYKIHATRLAQVFSFIITEDHISDEKDYNPRFIHNPRTLEHLSNLYPIPFKLYDDDGIHYYSGFARSDDALVEAHEWSMYYAGTTSLTSDGEVVFG